MPPTASKLVDEVVRNASGGPTAPTIVRTSGPVFHLGFAPKKAANPFSTDLLLAGGGGVAYGKGAPLGFARPLKGEFPHSVVTASEHGSLEEPGDWLSECAEVSPGQYHVAMGGSECVSFWKFSTRGDGLPDAPVLLAEYKDPGSTLGGREPTRVEKRRRCAKRVALAPSGLLAFVCGDDPKHRLHVVALRADLDGRYSAERLSAIPREGEIHSVSCAALKLPAAMCHEGSAQDWDSGRVLVACCDEKDITFHIVSDISQDSCGAVANSAVQWHPVCTTTVQQMGANPRNSPLLRHRYNRMFFVPGPARQICAVSTRPGGPSRITTFDLVWSRRSDVVTMELSRRRDVTLNGYSPLPCVTPAVPVCCADVSIDGSVLAYGTNDGTVAVATTSGDLIAMHPAAHGEDPVMSVAVTQCSPTELLVVSSCQAGIRYARVPVRPVRKSSILRPALYFLGCVACAAAAHFLVSSGEAIPLIGQKGNTTSVAAAAISTPYWRVISASWPPVHPSGAETSLDRLWPDGVMLVMLGVGVSVMKSWIATCVLPSLFCVGLSLSVLPWLCDSVDSVDIGHVLYLLAGTFFLERFLCSGDVKLDRVAKTRTFKVRRKKGDSLGIALHSEHDLALITNVRGGGACAKAGVRQGMRIVSVDSAKVKPHQVFDALAAAGERVEIAVTEPVHPVSVARCAPVAPLLAVMLAAGSVQYLEGGHTAEHRAVLAMQCGMLVMSTTLSACAALTCVRRMSLPWVLCAAALGGLVGLQWSWAAGNRACSSLVLCLYAAVVHLRPCILQRWSSVLSFALLPLCACGYHLAVLQKLT
eukprot:TRINITY_DN5935_c0_g1_i1.p1 TRINITY_DN5935_c0_g1~~TRINITY_DN5935_c0_g1_i1.p1  ORF type:complete len:815 (+),score=89.84 TRINITY_DN5935_c0_g1_i1:109-2553(+)